MLTVIALGSPTTSALILFFAPFSGSRIPYSRNVIPPFPNFFAFCLLQECGYLKVLINSSVSTLVLKEHAANFLNVSLYEKTTVPKKVRSHFLHYFCQETSVCT
ncbi:unnamed protein product [Albugo candida]|uniref:Uncharacterized protein n=1 Tax=Albugo candida TaxID=65357 RepID=A0A024GN04_9STRA|nr:unnamed protein product [Albugo candida]|eukprot:CCI48100.1 unnamed protein product [Albugo candida]